MIFHNITVFWANKRSLDEHKRPTPNIEWQHISNGCVSLIRRSSDQLDLVVDGLPVSLPTYEEAIYNSWGQRLPPFCGPTQLLLTQDASEHSPLTSLIHSDSNHCSDTANQSTETPPPPYEAVQSRSRDTEDDSAERPLQSALSVDKNN